MKYQFTIFQNLQALTVKIVTFGLFLQDNNVHIEKIPTVVTLQAIAEKPQIQVIFICTLYFRRF
jgi:hypothetical protein